MSDAAAAVLGAGVCALASPYLARLTLSVPDRGDERWWIGRTPSRARIAATAGAGGAVGALAGTAAEWTWALPAFLALALISAPLIPIDIEHHRLPNRLVFAAAIAAGVLLTVAAAATGHWHDWLRGFEGAAAVFTGLCLLVLIAPRSFGFGDAKLGGVLGAYLGCFGWPAVYYGIFAGFVVGMVMAVVLLTLGRAGRKTAIAFGPMLTLGALLFLALDRGPAP